MPSQSVLNCYCSNQARFRQLWYLVVDSVEMYMECCQVSYWAARRGTPCQVLPALVRGRQQLAGVNMDLFGEEFIPEEDKL